MFRVVSAEVGDDSSVETVNAVGSEFPVGFIDKPGGRPITIEYLQEQGTPEVDWQFIKDSKEMFALTRKVVGGRRYQYPECRVSTVEPKTDADGGHTISIGIIAIREKAL